jgi:hypothetical protein
MNGSGLATRLSTGILATALAGCGAAGGSVPQQYYADVCDAFSSLESATGNAEDVVDPSATRFTVTSKTNLVSRDAGNAIRRLDRVDEPWEPGATLFESLQSAATAYAEFAPAFRAATLNQDEGDLEDARALYDEGRAAYDAAVAEEQNLAAQGWVSCLAD